VEAGLAFMGLILSRLKLVGARRKDVLRENERCELYQLCTNYARRIIARIIRGLSLEAERDEFLNYVRVKGSDMKLNKQKMIELYRTMLKIREFEETVGRLFRQGKIPGMLHRYTGQEAVATGACAVLRKTDYITSTHRGHGHLIAKGADVKKMMAELFGKKTGYNKGKGGSMHIADFSIGILGANGIIGAGIPIAAGAGISIKRKGEDRVVVCFFGEGAGNRGTFHEGINLASTWNLPVVYLMENNLYASSTHQSRVQKTTDITKRAAPYDIPGISIDGNDVLAVYGTVKKLAERARKGDGPALVECMTYRWHGHYEGDPLNYRSTGELEEWKKRDPISRYKKGLLMKGVLSEQKCQRIEDEVRNEIVMAIKFAEESPYPDKEEALQDVFANLYEEGENG